MSRNGQTVASGLSVNLGVNTVFWSIALVVCAELGISQWVVVVSAGLGTLMGCFTTFGLSRDTPLKPYIAGKIAAWLVTVCVWSIVLTSFNGAIPIAAVMTTFSALMLLAFVAFMIALLSVASNTRRSLY